MENFLGNIVGVMENVLGYTVGIGMVVLSWVSLAAIVGFLGWQMVKK